MRNLLFTLALIVIILPIEHAVASDADKLAKEFHERSKTLKLFGVHPAITQTEFESAMQIDPAKELKNDRMYRNKDPSTRSDVQALISHDQIALKKNHLRSLFPIKYKKPIKLEGTIDFQMQEDALNAVKKQIGEGRVHMYVKNPNEMPRYQKELDQYKKLNSPATHTYFIADKSPVETWNAFYKACDSENTNPISRGHREGRYEIGLGNFNNRTRISEIMIQNIDNSLAAIDKYCSSAKGQYIEYLKVIAGPHIKFDINYDTLSAHYFYPKYEVIEAIAAAEANDR